MQAIKKGTHEEKGKGVSECVFNTDSMLVSCTSFCLVAIYVAEITVPKKKVPRGGRAMRGVMCCSNERRKRPKLNHIYVPVLYSFGESVWRVVNG